MDGVAASIAETSARLRWLRAPARLWSASRMIAPVAAAALCITTICGAVGFGLARQSDEHLAVVQRAALVKVVSEFRTLFGQPSGVDPRFVRMLEQSAGLASLRFETDPPPGGREIQPVLDGNGRIAGFFTWDRSYPAMDAVRRTVPIIFGAAMLLAGIGGYWLRQLRRARRDLAASEQRTRRAAAEDKLTGLPNHAGMMELLDRALAGRGAATVTLALIEIDGMADASAALGASASDALCAAVAQRMQDALPAGAVCGRIGTNEFAIIFTAIGLNVSAAIRAVLEAVGRPYPMETVARISGHAGLAQAPQHAATRGELTQRADLALRAAGKEGAGSVAMFEPSLEAAFAEHKFIARELPRALAANALELHYQPIVTAQGARIVGVEALLRWTHPERGSIAPAAFIPVAEQTGLMDALGAFVLRRALGEAKRWPGIYVAVNLSPLQVRDRSLVAVVRSALAESGVEPSRLMLEITEGVLVDNPEEMVARIEDLHALGVRVALDDFGSGYSNLGYLQRFPLDKLKIDKSFVSALGKSANGGVIIQAVVGLGRALGLSVVVEGVETEEQRVLLRLAGCDEMQGYLFARPAPARSIDRLLARRNKMPARQGGGEPLTARA